MRKYKTREIKELVKSGAAVDITNYSGAERQALKDRESSLEKVGYSVSTYGIAGGILQGASTGKLYAITTRSSSLFYWF